MLRLASGRSGRLRFLCITLLLLPVCAPPKASAADSSDDDRTSKASSINCDGMIYTAVLVAVAACKMCNHNSNEVSPLTSAHDGDEFSGLRPWMRKKPHPSKEGFCCARARICRICHTTFHMSSLATTHGSIQKYLKHAKKEVSALTLFRKLVATWIKVHNEDPNAAKMKVRRELEESEGVESNKSEGLREKGGYHAVELEIWKEDSPGTTPPKVGKQLLKEYDCVKDVVWLRKNKKGWHEFRSYRDEGVEHVTVHEDGSLMLSATQAEEKYAVVNKIRGNTGMHGASTMDDYLKAI